ncbi:MAG: hypothetical protein HY270_03950, partial [Deltaproteobacteria bacterium]|nr:hypothetical protein [Deltaproteobacteria bacterium]
VVIINRGRIVVEDMLATLTQQRSLEETFLYYITKDAATVQGEAQEASA